MPNFSALPTEILIQILFHLDPQELSALAQCGRMLHDLVYEFGWLQYLLSNPRPSYSLSESRKHWSTCEQVRYNTLTDRAWQKVKFTARPLSRTDIPPFLLVPPSSGKPSMRWEGSINLNETHVRGRNIVSIGFIDDGGLDNTLLVAYQEHLVERITLVAPTPDGETPLSFTRTPLPVFPKGDYIESFSTCSGHLLSLSSNGVARLAHQSILFNGEDNIPKSSWISTIDLAERSWKSHLSLTSSTPFAALGSTSKTPLTIHNILPDSGLSALPSVIPHTEKSTDPDNLSSSAVYGITQAPLSSPWGSSPQILASGWFDGRARIYDLRCASHSPKPSCTNPKFLSTGTPLLTPVLIMADRWSTEPVYALSSGGGSGAHLAAGTARHSVVSFWDGPRTRDGWSVHASGNDRSPVFDVTLKQ
ncbi:hypothetical protein NMY22_g12156 [Coprinellus aureogranulatus]|nr:hypothetical protein NMY22_g12156 [Coprinellus aureogranulatus]